MVCVCVCVILACQLYTSLSRRTLCVFCGWLWVGLGVCVVLGGERVGGVRGRGCERGRGLAVGRSRTPDWWRFVALCCGGQLGRARLRNLWPRRFLHRTRASQRAVRDRSTMGCGSSKRVKPTGPCLVLYSNFAAELPNFEEALRQCGTACARYDFATATAEYFSAILSRLVKEHGPFERIALAPHGPHRPPRPSIPQGHECWWELSEAVIMTDPTQLSQVRHPAREVLVALGKATVAGGCVDLLSCAILSTWACPDSMWPVLPGFRSIEEEASCSFAACAHALGADSPLSADDEWLMETNDSINIKHTYFLPPPSKPSPLPTVLDAQLAYAQANASEIHTSPILEHYTLGATLGRGRFAVVHRASRRAAQHVRIPAHIAIKVIDKARTDELESVRSEVAFMTRLDHPNIIRLYEIFEQDKKLYLVMELASGGDLFDRIITRGSFSEADASAAVSQLCSALKHVHAKGIIHRDLKPENLLVASPADDAPIKIADFGLAAQHRVDSPVSSPPRASPSLIRQRSPLVTRSPRPSPLNQQPSPPSQTSGPLPPSTKRHVSPKVDTSPPRLKRQASPKVDTSTPRLTASSTSHVGATTALVGSPSYMAPEVLTNAVYTPGCDMWAVGVILFFSLKGQPPFVAGEVGAELTLREKITRCVYDQCDGDDWADVSAEAKDLIRRLLVVDHRTRLSAQAALAHPWIADGEISRQGSFRLQGDGIVRLNSHRELTRKMCVEQVPGDFEETTSLGSPVVSLTLPKARHVEFANETWR